MLHNFLVVCLKMNSPKVFEVISVILREMEILDYNPEVVVNLSDFVYNYVTSVLTEARNISADPGHLTRQDTLFAIKYVNDNTVFLEFDEILKCAKLVNKEPLPEFMGKIGLNLPPERYCLNKCNYALRRY